MIQIDVDSSQIVVEGHAGFAPLGQDIVCAGISALTQTLVQALNVLAQGEAVFHIDPGKAVIKFQMHSEKSRLLVSSFFIGVEMIAQEYPENVTLVCTDQTWMS